jgi:hypothetical protein
MSLCADRFDGAAAWFSKRLNLATGGGPLEPVETLRVTGRYFETPGVPALLGRLIAPHDDARAGTDGPVAVISYGLWHADSAGPQTSSAAA